MLKEQITQIFKRNERRYGAPRIHKELKRRGICCGRKRVERLMKEQGLVAQGKRKFKVTTDSKHKHPVAPNLLGRYFQTTAPNQVWTGDLTYLHTAQGWLYLAIVLDLFSRRVVGWAMGSRINAGLVVKALQMAVATRSAQPGLIFHSDRGSQYAGHLFQKQLTHFAITPSMSRKGDPWDNAPTESFFATLKKELIRGQIYSTREEAMGEVFRYIEGYYNNFRLHSYLNYATPAEFERMIA